MILSDIGNYLKERKRASVADIANRFDVDPDVVRNMLAVLERKRRIHRIPNVPACGSSCRQCDSASIELYAWGKASGEPDVQATCRDI